jgi:hypothetical protein
MKDALKLALEALTSGVDAQVGRVVWTEYDSCLIAEAITAIREALAQPAQEPKHLVNLVIAHIKDLRKCVVELQKHGGFDETAAEIGVAADELEAALAAPPAAQPPLPVQPERQPLTDEQIQQIWDVAAGSIPGWSRHIAYARAIESAHNIGAKK